MFNITEQKGDLFTCPDTSSMAHCVSADFNMGAGIARKFKSKFKDVDKLLEQKGKTGDIAVLEHNKRYIYYLITKDR